MVMHLSYKSSSNRIECSGVDIDDISSILFELDFAEPWEIISANLTVVDEVLAQKLNKI